MLPAFAYVRPKNLKEATRQANVAGARIHAEGTDLLGCLRDGVFEAEKVVSLSGLDTLRGIESKGNGVAIGALTTITEVAESPELKERYRALAQGASEVASPQLRHQGTLGGNLCQKPRCWYYRGEFDCRRKGGELCFAAGGENQFHCLFGGKGCVIVHPSDTAPALVAFDARLNISGPRGDRTVPVEDFHVLPATDPTRETVLEPGEIVTRIELPAPPKGMKSANRKVRARQAWDFAVAGGAFALAFDSDRVERAAIVLSGAAPVPWRAAEAEKVLQGKPLTPETARKAAEAAMDGARPLKHNHYKVNLFKGMIEEELLKLAKG